MNVMTDKNTTKEMIQQMRDHVASYKSLSTGRHNCLELCRRLEELEAQVRRAEALPRHTVMHCIDYTPPATEIIFADELDKALEVNDE